MNNYLNITGLQVKSIEVDKDDTKEVNKFLTEHDMDIIDINIIPLLYGKTRYVIVYKTN